MENTKARSFVVLMIIIAISSLLLRIVIDSLIKINMTQNESRASVTLKFISAALESYAKDNAGLYPEEISLLTQTNPPYLEKDYISLSPLKGYNYSCPRFDSSGYTCYATPIKCKLSGKTIYTITSGGLLISEGCEKKE